MGMLEKARDWQIDFGPVSGAAGTTATINVQPQCSFRAEKCLASDTASVPGTGTRIMTILVGNRLQRPTGASGGTPTIFFGPAALGNGVRWDNCEKGLTISVTVSYVVACTFDLTVFGKAVI